MLIDWFTVAAQVINFLALVWLLKRFLYKPVLNAIDEREKRIATQLQEAEAKKAAALKEEADFMHKNEEFEQHRVGLLADATHAAKAEQEKLLASARKDAEGLRAKSQKASQDEAANLNITVGALVQKEVFAVARKALLDLAGVNLEERMAEVFLRRLHDLNDEQRQKLKDGLPASQKPAVVGSTFNLSDQQKAAIENAIKALIGETTTATFETKPGLICGIELVAGGQKIAWSVADYLVDLSASLGKLSEPKADAPTAPPEIVAHAA
jgi:F-type H+-transporting ATPase subunit b